ncbi:Methyltransferase domain-containing protein [Lachnospiraceae bacterium XBB1006]|nr:Methyltransferase domain-containing protein [Lachnospiraceae bacterium XBB1006]
MFWDTISPVYDLFENIYNSKVFNGTGEKVAEMVEPSDMVLECACGTGAISVFLAKKCRRLFATDFSTGMLKQAEKKCHVFDNVVFKKTDITNIKCKDGQFDKAVAGNVIHLLPKPEIALRELERVVKPGGKIIIPTYINSCRGSGKVAVKFLELLGANFNRQFNFYEYVRFFKELGYDADYYMVEGRMPCAIAVITKK